MRKILLTVLFLTLSMPVLQARGFAEEAVGSEGLLFMEIPSVITSTLREQKASEAPSPMTVITKNDIKLRGYHRLSEVIDDVVGFEPISDGNEVLTAVRGAFASTTNKIITLVNGHRMNDLFLGRYNINQFINMDAVERIEFIRGGGSVLYGSGALLGVINIITKKGAEIDGTLITSDIGSEIFENALTYGEKVQDMDILVNVTMVDAVGSEIPVSASKNPAPAGQTAKDGFVYWNRYPSNWSAMSVVNTPNTSITLRAEHTEQVVPRAIYTTYDYENEPLRPRYNEQHFFMDYKRTFEFNERAKFSINPSITYIGFWDQSVTIAGADYFPPYGKRSGSLNEHNIYGLKALFEKDFDYMYLITGIDFLLANFFRNDFNNVITDPTRVVTPQIVIDPDSQGPKGTWLIAGYLAQSELKLRHNLTATLGMRYDTFQGRADPHFTPRIALVYLPTQKLTAKAMYSSSYFAPQWIHTNKSSTGQFMGVPDIDPEQSENYDLIFEYNADKLRLTSDLFQSRVYGLITNVLKGTIFTYENIGESLYRGAEVSAKYEINKITAVEGSWCLVKPVESETTASLLQNGQIKDIPENIFRCGFIVKPLRDFNVSLWGRHLTSVETTEVTALDASNVPTATSMISVPGVTLLDMAVTYDIKDLTLHIKGSNITDMKYSIAGARNGIGSPLPMRGFVYEVGVGYKF